jgi:hypothetical protein
MSKLTRRQHTVPDFYQSQWADPKGHITCHDIPKGETFTCDPTVHGIRRAVGAAPARKTPATAEKVVAVVGPDRRRHEGAPRPRHLAPWFCRRLPSL